MCPFKAPPCVHSKRFRVYWQHNASTHGGRFECTHRDVLDGHTPGFVKKKKTRVGHMWSYRLHQKFTKENPWISTIQSLKWVENRTFPIPEILRFQSDSCSTSAILRETAEGPAVRWFGLSFAAKSKCNKRFARQYRLEAPPEFLLILPFSSWIHFFLTRTTFTITEYTQTCIHTQTHTYIHKNTNRSHDHVRLQVPHKDGSVFSGFSFLWRLLFLKRNDEMGEGGREG